MPMMKNVLGLDLGSHSIKAVELRQTLRGLEPGQLRLQPRSDDEPLSEAVNHLVRLHHLSTEHVTCALPGDRVSSRRLTFPFRDKKKLAQAVPFEVEGQIPFELDDVIVDWQLTSAERSRGIVTATIAQREDVSAFLKVIDAAGCPPRILEAEGLALANLLGLFDLPETGLIADLGHQKTTLCLVVAGQPVAARSIPAAGQAITRALAADLGLTLEQAEQRKCDAGIFDAAGNAVSPGTLAVVDRIAREILRMLESHEHILAAADSSADGGMTLVGGGAHLAGIEDYLAQRTRIPTQCLRLPEDEERAALVAGGDPVLFGPAIALALRSSAKAVTKLNFRQDEFSYRADFSRLFGVELRPTIVLAAIALFLLGVSTTTSIALESRKADALERQAGLLYEQIFPNTAPPERPMAALSQAVSSARERADFLGLYQGNHSALDLMSELSSRVPNDLKVRFEEINIDRKVIRIKVTAENYEAMDRLENQLKAGPPFEHADVSGQAKRLKDGSVSFSVSVPLEREENDR